MRPCCFACCDRHQLDSAKGIEGVYKGLSKSGKAANKCLAVMEVRKALKADVREWRNVREVEGKRTGPG